MSRSVFLKQPKEMNLQKKLLKLKRSVYGLVDAPRKWYQKVRSELEKIGCIVSKFDPGVFYVKVNHETICLLCVHVDDVWWTGTQSFQNMVLIPLRQVFSVGREAGLPMKYLGFDIDSFQGGFIIKQREFQENLFEVTVPKSRQNKDDATTPEEK